MRKSLLLRAYFSPFKRPKMHWYFGKTAVHTPAFLPRRWVLNTAEDAIVSATKHLNNPNLIKLPFSELYEKYKKYQKAVPKRIGFDFIDVGWKTKYGSYRHEYNAVWSFVFFGYQVAVQFIPENDTQYWESFLAFTYETDEKLSWKERIEDCKERFPCVWSSYSGDERVTTDYWTKILKKKYEI